MDEQKPVQSTPPVATPDAVPSEVVATQGQGIPVAARVEGEAASIQTNAVRQFDKTFSELQAIQSSVKKFKPGDLVVPVLSLLALGLLTIFVYIPMVTSGMKFRAESQDTKSKITQLNKLGSDLDAMDITLLQTDLSNARTVIPFSLQVSDFVSYVDDSAKSNGLEFREILAGDIAVRTSAESKGVDPVMRGVSGPLKYSGNFTEITSFLDEIQDASPFIVATDQVKLKQTESGQWELALTVTGYYINQDAITKPNIYSPFSSYTQFTPTIDVFTQKASKLQK